MDQATTSMRADDGSTGTADKPGTTYRTRRRAFPAMGAAAILAVGVDAGTFTSRSGPFAAKVKPTTSTFSSAIGTIIKGDLQRQTPVPGTLRYSGSHRFKSDFEGVLIQVPASGAVLTQGDVLYRTGNETAHLIYGSLPAWRNSEAGMEDGEDIRQLETVLRNLGYSDYEPDDHLSWVITSAILKRQKDPDLPRTGTLPLGWIVFTPGDSRVGMVTARVGDHVAADTELFDITSTTQAVNASIKLSDQKLAVVGTAVTIKLPDAKKTAGKIISAGIPTERSSGSGSGADSGPGSDEFKERVILITVAPTDASATTNFQEASVTVDLPNEKRMGVPSVPVGTLLALSADQYGVEIVEAGGTTRKAPVTIGLLAGGCVEISGQDTSERQRVVVPQT